MLEFAEQPGFSVLTHRHDSSCRYPVHNNVHFSDLAYRASKLTWAHVLVLEATPPKWQKKYYFTISMHIALSPAGKRCSLLWKKIAWKLCLWHLPFSCSCVLEVSLIMKKINKNTVKWQIYSSFCLPSPVPVVWLSRRVKPAVCFRHSRGAAAVKWVIIPLSLPASLCHHAALSVRFGRERAEVCRTQLLSDQWLLIPFVFRRANETASV